MREDRTREMDIGREDVYIGEGERRGAGRQRTEGVRTTERQRQ